MRHEAMRKSTTDKPTLVSVYSGRELRGYILNRGILGFEAFDSGERSLGLYRTLRQAADAVSADASS
jgi:hypothetical protein